MRRPYPLVAGLVLVALATGPEVGRNISAAAETAEVVSLAPACENAPADRFHDVTGIHGAGIDCIVWWGVASGIGGQTYDPSGDVSRGQLATLIARTLAASGAELPGSPVDAFRDDDGTTHEAAINQLAQLGVLNGVSEDRYATTDSVSRGQMATLLATAWEAIVDEPLTIDGEAVPDAFPDATGSLHEAGIRAVTASGLASGTTASTFTPGADVSRAQMGTFLARLLAKLVADGHAAYPPADPVSASDVAGCTDQGTDVVIAGVQDDRWHERDLDAGTAIDARGGVWAGVGDDPVRVGSQPGICWQGGTIDGQYDEDFTWDDAHDTAAFSIYGPDFTLADLRIHLEGDLVNLKDDASDFTLSRIHLSQGRDDCIENDYVHSGVLQDSLLDGCYTALSARPSSDRDEAAPDNTWTIRRNLIRLEAMPHVYKPEKYGQGPGHGQFFKWGKDGNGVGVSLHDNVFMAEQLPNDGDPFAFPDEYLRDCTDNVIVWLGDGDFPGEWPDDCFTITTDPTVWNDAVTNWKTTHTPN